MKIIFLEAVQDHGGARKSTIELANRLKKNGVNILFVDFYGTNNEFLSEIKKNNLKYKVLKKRYEPFILGNKNKFIQLKNYIVFLIETIFLKSKLNGIIKDFKPNFVFVNGTKTLSILPNNSSYKTVFFARGWFIKSQLSKIDIFLLKKKVDLFLAVSQSTRHALFCNQIMELENIYVVKNGIDLNPINKVELDDNKSELILLHSGGFLPSKGHHISIEISKKLKESGIDHHLYLTGKIYKEAESMEYHDAILKLIEKHGLGNEIDIVVNKNNIQPYFEKADIFIHPSDTEGLPRVVMEAMANKCVVIANAVGGVTDYILDGYTGYITDFNDVDSYVSKIKHLINNTVEKNEVKERAFTLIEKCYTGDIQLKEITRILKKELTNTR
ncbi:MAG: glycosyltransferase family 4 protein [Tissierellia bacterium]|nr:glycosyltransferase family 4 protein [Tissierellia bacterium]